MTRIHFLCLMTALVVGPALSTAHAAEEVANPQFVSWAKFAVNSQETLVGEVEAAGQKMTTTTVRKLVGKGDDAVTVELSVSIEFGGQVRSVPPRTVKLPARIAKQDVEQVGSEEITAAGKTFACKVLNAKGVAAQNPTATARIWVCNDVPGGIVKMEVKTPNGSLTQLLKTFEAK